MRLDKFVMKSTDFTKQQAKQVIEAGEVRVNGEIVQEVAHQVHENNEVMFANQRLLARPFRYLLMNKPANTICSNIDEVYPSALNLLTKDRQINGAEVENGINQRDELHIAGRLDADTTGLILITDDGRWTFNITLPTNLCPKVYRVTLSKPFKPELINIFKQGIQLQGEKALTQPAQVQIISEQQVLLTITEGKFHQVKRMFAAVGNRVVGLHREQIGQVKLDVELGQWRYLTPLEVNSF
ncbi:16S rRNA pseudouridine(516) synthase [Psychromonas sp. B3M02]|uniref:pseudouridine synthase n=1 Tax=Psychromonas sp. B3M02 TaxID=2267226 RepID=UPI000DEA5D8A|nr:pseudouridine synthase [Psychromonas sp. B3M02]RBW42614.1 16S rRNA pseudouridine(516) synthase [Psychromonas sp. B3M02]